MVKPSDANIATFVSGAEDTDLVRKLLSTSRACVKLVDTDGRLVAMNPDGQTLMEIEDFSMFCGLPWSSMWPAESQRLIDHALDRAASGHSTSFTAYCPTAKGSPRWWDVDVMPIFANDGTVRQIISTSHDVTHHKQRQNELQSQIGEREAVLNGMVEQLEAQTERLLLVQSQINHSEKLRVLGSFVGTIVHDINNVLAVMQGAGRILRRKFDDPANEQIFEQVDLSVDRGKTLVRRLLDFSRKSEDEPERIHVSKVIADDQDLMRQMLGKAIELELELDEECGPILTDVGRIQAVVFNLLANARDALPEGGTVRISTANRTVEVGEGTDRTADYAVLSIRDNGVGMDADTLRKLGQPFFTTKGRGFGTGLGLASAYQLAEDCGGEVRIDSEPGVGTTVELLLRRADASGHRGEFLDHELDTAGHGAATILLLHDDGFDRRMIGDFLRSLNYELIEVTTPDLALAKLMQNDRIELLVADGRYAREDHSELFDRIAQLQPALPILRRGEEGGDGASEAERFAQAVLLQLGRNPARKLSVEARARNRKVGDRIKDHRLAALMQLWMDHAERADRLPAPADCAGIEPKDRQSAIMISVAGAETEPHFTVESVSGGRADGSALPGIGTRLDTGEMASVGPIAMAYRRAIAGVVWWDGAEASEDGQTVRTERLILPLSEDGEGVTHLLAVIASKDI